MRMNHRPLMHGVSALALTALLAACGGSSDSSDASDLPALGADRLVFDSTRRSANREIFVMKNDGTEIRRLTADSAYEHWWPKISPDGTSIAGLTNADPSANGGVGAWGIRMADADGSNIRALIDDGQINSKPAWSLDGDTVYFHRVNFAEEAAFGLFRIRKTGTGLTRLTAAGTGVNEFPAN